MNLIRQALVFPVARKMRYRL